MKAPLTRYEYCLGTKCQRLLWLCTHRNDEGFYDRELSKLQDRQLLLEYMEGHPDITYIDEENLYMAMAKTADAVYKKKTNLSCGAFVKGAVSCRPDLIKKREDGTYDLYVIKAITHLRQSICHDASYQIFVLAANGIKVNDVYFVHINADYVLGRSKPSEKLITERITRRVKSLLSSVEKRATRALKTIRNDEIPELDIRSSCFTPFECENKSECFSSLPKDNIFGVSGIDRNTKIELYKKNYIKLDEIKDNVLLPPQSRKHIDMYLRGRKAEVNTELLGEFVDSLWYPMCFLDFECMQLPSPAFENTRPYEQLAFQFSLHVVEKKGDSPQYRGYISKPLIDPRREIAVRLARDIPDGACVVAYGSQLEKKIVSDLAKMYPDLREKLTKIHDNINDLFVPIEKKYYYEPRTLGANSLKAVLHAMYPEEESLNYKNLEGVHNGKEAAISYAMISCGDTTKDVDTVLRELENYCSLDTLALVKILDKFYEALNR